MLQKLLALARKLIHLFFQALRLIAPLLRKRGNGFFPEFLFVLLCRFQLHQQADTVGLNLSQLLAGGGGGVEVDPATA